MAQGTSSPSATVTSGSRGVRSARIGVLRVPRERCGRGQQDREQCRVRSASAGASCMQILRGRPTPDSRLPTPDSRSRPVPPVPVPFPTGYDLPDDYGVYGWWRARESRAGRLRGAHPRRGRQHTGGTGRAAGARHQQRRRVFGPDRGAAVGGGPRPPARARAHGLRTGHQADARRVQGQARDDAGIARGREAADREAGSRDVRARQARTEQGRRRALQPGHGHRRRQATGGSAGRALPRPSRPRWRRARSASLVPRSRNTPARARVRRRRASISTWSDWFDLHDGRGPNDEGRERQRRQPTLPSD